MKRPTTHNRNIPKRVAIDPELFDVLSHRSIDEHTSRQGCLHVILCQALGRPDLLGSPPPVAVTTGR